MRRMFYRRSVTLSALMAHQEAIATYWAQRVKRDAAKKKVNQKKGTKK